MKLKALTCKGGEFKASVTYSFHLFRRMYFYLQVTHFYMAIQNVILTLQYTAQ